MVSRRREKLLLQAAVDGTIDFYQADLLDPAWYRHVEYRLEALERKLATEYMRMNLLRRMTDLIVARSPSAVEALDREMQTYSRLLFHLPSENESRTERIVSEGQQLWEAAWGKLSDPEVQDRIDRVAAELRQRRTAA